MRKNTKHQKIQERNHKLAEYFLTTFPDLYSCKCENGTFKVLTTRLNSRVWYCTRCSTQVSPLKHTIFSSKSFDTVDMTTIYLLLELHMQDYTIGKIARQRALKHERVENMRKIIQSLSIQEVNFYKNLILKLFSDYIDLELVAKITV